MKKLFALTAVSVLMLVGIHAHAAYEPVLRTSEDNRSYTCFTKDVTDGELSVQGFTAEVRPMLDKFRKETENVSEYIDLRGYRITADNEDALFALTDRIYETLVFCSPLSYYLTNADGTYSYYLSFGDDAGTGGLELYGISPVYDLDIYNDDTVTISDDKLKTVMPEITENREFINSEITAIMDIAADTELDFDKLLLYHNYIDLNYDYAHDEQQGLVECTHNNILPMLRDKISLCQTFSILYNYILMENGFDTAFVTSYYTIDGFPFHTWNLVKLATEETDYIPYWYHIDITWNNLGIGISNPDKLTLEYFLVSDEQLKKTHNLTLDGLDIRYYLDTGSFEKSGAVFETSTVFDDAAWHTNVYSKDTVRDANAGSLLGNPVSASEETATVDLMDYSPIADTSTASYRVFLKRERDNSINVAELQVDDLENEITFTYTKGEVWKIFIWNMDNNMIPLYAPITSEN